ncbi:MAG: hypothetical protein QOF41_2116 [Methylobacteriaceae bacterium]|nr:hypothetical protein [Methylobacteriaceae bacterium]
MRALIALAAPALAGAFLIAAPSGAAPLPLARPDAAPQATQVQWGGGGYGERREEYREHRRDDGDRWRERREWRGGDGDDWRRREYRRRMFCRMHPGAC